MNKQLLIITAALGIALTSARPAAAAAVNLLTIQVNEPGPRFTGRWFGRHEGRLGWWEVDRGQWRAHERHERQERQERHERREFAWRR